MANPLKFQKKSTDHETIFLQHYDWLLKWARQITHGHAGEAEDLVQDLYIRFIRSSAPGPLDTDEQARAYLYTALKNLYISKKLRNGRDAISGLRAVDFDSVESALVSIERNQLLYVRSDLARICEYACLRRADTRAASALILRYFLGYLPPEIMMLLQTSRSNVNSLIENGRLEAKAFVGGRGSLRFMGTAKKRETQSKTLPEQTGALFLELKRRVFSEQEGSCFCDGELESFYASASGRSLSTVQIAHLTSCTECLGLATRILDLPHFSLRFFDDHGPSDDGNLPPTAAEAQGELDRLRRKLREGDEHRPKKLQIAVDGEIRGVQTITGAESRFQIKLPALSQPRFLEVISEQGVGLLYLDLQEEFLDAPSLLMTERTLSGDRRLEARLSLSDGVPVVDVYYCDPLMEAVSERVIGTQKLSEFTSSGAQSAAARLSRFLSPSHWNQIIRFLLSRKWIFAFVAVAAVTCGSAIFRKMQRQAVTPPVPSAATLISNAHDRARLNVPAAGGIRAVYQMTRRGERGTVTDEARIEAVRSMTTSRSLLRYIAPSGVMLAARSVTADGKQKTFTRPRSHRHTTNDSLQSNLWSHVPNVDEFLTLAQTSPIAVVPKATGYEIGFTRSRSEHNSVVIGAHLLLDNASLRPVWEELDVASGDKQVTYEFSEVSYEILDAGHFEQQIAVATVSSPASDVSDTLASPNISSLKLHVLGLLADDEGVEDAIDVQQTTANRVAVSGSLADTSTLSHLLQEFRSLPGRSMLQCDLHVAGEADTKATTSSGSPKVMIVDATAPTTVPLARLLSPNGAATEQAASDTLVRAHELLLAGAKMHRQIVLATALASRTLSTSEIQALDPEDRRLWLRLMDHHLRTAALDFGDIGALLHIQSSASEDVRPLDNLIQFTSALGQLGASSDRLNQMLVQGFSASQQPGSPTLDGSEFPPLLASIHQQERALGRTIERLQ